MDFSPNGDIRPHFIPSLAYPRYHRIQNLSLKLMLMYSLLTFATFNLGETLPLHIVLPHPETNASEPALTLEPDGGRQAGRMYFV